MSSDTGPCNLTRVRGIPVIDEADLLPTPPRQVRQGDVLLVAVDRIPEQAEPESRGERIVLAEGEATGHAHAIHERDARTYVHDGERYLLTKSKAQLVHEEHASIEIAPGAWQVILQREYEPAAISALAWRRVRD